MLRDFKGQGTDREYEQFVGLMSASEKPLFPGCKVKFTLLYGVLELLKLKASNRWSDKSFIDLLCLLGDIFRRGTSYLQTHIEQRRCSIPWDWKLKRYMHVRMTVSCTGESLQTY